MTTARVRRVELAQGSAPEQERKQDVQVVTAISAGNAWHPYATDTSDFPGAPKIC